MSFHSQLFICVCVYFVWKIEGCWCLCVCKSDSIFKYNRAFWQLTSTKIAAVVTEASLSETFHCCLCAHIKTEMLLIFFSARWKRQGVCMRVCMCVCLMWKPFYITTFCLRRQACLVWADAMPRVEQLFINWALSCHSFSQNQDNYWSNLNFCGWSWAGSICVFCLKETKSAMGGRRQETALLS